MSNLIYCDTNIIRYILDTPNAPSRFAAHLRREDLQHGISVIQLTELLKLPRYHSALAELIYTAGSHLFHWWKSILVEEVGAYPNTHEPEVVSPWSLATWYSTSGGVEGLRCALAGSDISLLWEEFEDQKSRYRPVMDWLPSTLPKSPTKQAIDIDFTLHNHGVVLQILREIAPEFVESLKVDPLAFDPTYFRGAYVHAAYNYYRYVLKGMKATPSDVPDLHQVFYIPYCSIVIMEKSMAGILSELKRDRSLLCAVKIQSMRYARSHFGMRRGSA